MLPDNTASSIAIGGLYHEPDNFITTPLVDWERGGVALLDMSQGMLYQNWRCWLRNGIEVALQADNMEEPIVLFSQPGITALAFCFDQNMHWAVAYVQDELMRLRWFDSAIQAYTTSVFPDALYPKMTLDDKRPTQLAGSDMILAYIRNGKLCYRQQRDRFGVEIVMRDVLYQGARIKSIGKNKGMRLQFEMI